MAKIKQKQEGLEVPNIVLDARCKEITLIFQIFFKSSQNFLERKKKWNVFFKFPQMSLQSPAKEGQFSDSKRDQKLPTKLPQIESTSQNPETTQHNSRGPRMDPRGPRGSR